MELEVFDSNRVVIYNTLERYRDQLVLDGFKVVQLLDVVDGEDDYYWIFNTRRHIIWASCVGGFIPLKDHLPEKEYTDLKRTWDYNDQYQWDGGESLSKLRENGWNDV